MATKETPSEKRATKHQAKIEGWFKGKTFRLLKEVRLTDGTTFQTPFGHRGKEGYILVEDTPDAIPFVIGKHLLAKIERDYGQVVRQTNAQDVVESTASTIAPGDNEYTNLAQ